MIVATFEANQQKKAENNTKNAEKVQKMRCI